LDCRKANLRVATNSLNSVNRQTKPLTGFRGVYRYRLTSFAAKITVDRKERSLGIFHRAEDAARAYDKAAHHAFGSFAHLNFPEDFSEAQAS
jgi:hypothetical protein